MTVQGEKQLEQSYDEVPYESLSYGQSHPSNTAMVARLFGLTPPDFKKARVLELGCSGGGNLSPLALAYPSSEFLGVDFSQEEINEANALKNFAKLKNIEFLRQDILTFDTMKHKDAFDYIICHGVFSWVPPPVAAKIMQICGACLKPNGIAYISYNALPGWNAVRSIRSILMDHASRFKTPEEKIRECRKFLDFLADNAAPTSGYKMSLEQERGMLKHLDDFYFFHDHLSGENFQFYFRDFMRMANEQGLSYIGDAELTHMFFETQSETVVKMLKTFDNIIDQEQYMDYVTNRRFRSTILCKSAQKMTRQLNSKQLLDFYLTTNMKVRGENGDPARPITFLSGTSQFVSDNLLSSSLFLELIACSGRPIKAEDLIARTQAKLKLPDAQPLRDALAKGSLGLVMRGFIRLHADCPPCAATLSEKPVASPIARYQSSKRNCKRVTNLLGQEIGTDEVSSVVLQALDGSRTLKDASALLANKLLGGNLQILQDGKPVTGAGNIRTAAESATVEIATRLLGNCFFMA